MEVAARLVFADVKTTADNSSYFAARWRASHVRLHNHLGFREREFDPVPVPGAYRIAVVGDSFTWGQGLDAPDRLTNRLERALRHEGVAAEVLNFGQPGANLQRNLENLETALDSARPDFVLLQWFENDMMDPPAHPPRDARLGWKLHPYLNRYSALYFLANNAFQRWLIYPGYLPRYGRYVIENFKEPDGLLVDVMHRRLLAIFELARSREVPLAAVLWPYVDSLSDYTTFSFLMDQTLATCQSKNVRCIDLRPVLRQGVEAGDLVVDEFDGHPNALANALAAEAVLDALGPEWRAAAAAKAPRPKGPPR